MPTTTPRTQWPTTLQALALVFAVIAYAYWPTLGAMFQIWWRSDTYTHGMLVPFISAWLIWRKREQLAAVSPRSMLWPVIPLALAVFAWLLGALTAVNALTQFALIFIVVASAIALLGNAASKVIAFPLLFLFFALPVGDFLMPRLMEWTADFTVIALRSSGVPVYREGQNFIIPSGSWSVVEACSGIRYLIASLTVGTLYAYLTYHSLKRRLIFVAISIIVPIVANWLRAYLIVMLGHLSGNKLAVGVDHLIYGWVFFGVVIAIMFAIGMRWAETEVRPGAANPQLAHAVANRPGHYSWLTALLLAVVVSSGPLADQLISTSNNTAVPQLALPQAAVPWQSQALFTDLQPEFANPSAEAHQALQSGDHTVGLYIAYYRNQNFDRKLVTSTNVVVSTTNKTWRIATSTRQKQPAMATTPDVSRYELIRQPGLGDERYIAWQWYWINGHLTASAIEAKWLTAWSLLSGQGDDSAAIIIYAPKATAGEALNAFSQDVLPGIYRTLGEARGR
jgi:exosortase A